MCSQLQPFTTEVFAQRLQNALIIPIIGRLSRWNEFLVKQAATTVKQTISRNFLVLMYISGHRIFRIWIFMKASCLTFTLQIGNQSSSIFYIFGY